MLLVIGMQRLTADTPSLISFLGHTQHVKVSGNWFYPALVCVILALSLVGLTPTII